MKRSEQRPWTLAELRFEFSESIACQVAAGGSFDRREFSFIPKNPRKSLVYATHFLFYSIYK